MEVVLAWFSGTTLCLPICLEVTTDSSLEFYHRFHLRIVQRRWKYTWGSGPCYLQSWNDRKIRWVSEEGGFKMEWCRTEGVPRIISFCDNCFLPPSQDCVRIENVETLVLQAPKDSFAQKSSERGIGQATHRFTFSQVWRYWFMSKGPTCRGSFILSLKGSFLLDSEFLIYACLQFWGLLLCANQCIKYFMCTNSQHFYYYYYCPYFPDKDIIAQWRLCCGSHVASQW